MNGNIHHAYALRSRHPVDVCRLTKLMCEWVDEWSEPPSSGKEGRRVGCTALLHRSWSCICCLAWGLRQELSWQQLSGNQQVLCVSSHVPRSQGFTLFLSIVEFHQVSTWRGTRTCSFPVLTSQYSVKVVSVVVEWCIQREPNAPRLMKVLGLYDECSYDVPQRKCGWCNCQRFACTCMCLSRQTWERPVLSSTWHTEVKKISS